MDGIEKHHIAALLKYIDPKFANEPKYYYAIIKSVKNYETFPNEYKEFVRTFAKQGKLYKPRSFDHVYENMDAGDYNIKLLYSLLKQSDEDNRTKFWRKYGDDLL